MSALLSLSYACKDFILFSRQSLVSTTNEVVKYIIYPRIHVLQAMVCTPSVLNYRPFDFFDFKLDHSFYLKICIKYHFFSRGLLYQYKIFKNNLNLTIFTEVFE